MVSEHDLWPVEDTPIGPQHTFAPASLPAYVASSASKEWFTPKWLLEEVYNVLGTVTLDPAAPPPPHTQWVRALNYITEQEDGLKAAWRGVVYLNPPYGRAIGKWVAKLAELNKLGYVREAILLVPARTDARWFEDVWAADCLCFITGRLQFEGPNKGKNTATFPSVLAYYGPRYSYMRFARVFARYGQVIDPRTLAV